VQLGEYATIGREAEWHEIASGQGVQRRDQMIGNSVPEKVKSPALPTAETNETVMYNVGRLKED